MKSRISRIVLFVKDVEGVAAFYQKHFGLEPVGEPEKGWLELGAGGVNLALHKAHGPSSGADSPVKICFECADVHAQVAAFEAEGLKFKKIFDWNGFSFADTVDPEGNPVQISSRGL